MQRRRGGPVPRSHHPRSSLVQPIPDTTAVMDIAAMSRPAEASILPLPARQRFASSPRRRIGSFLLALAIELLLLLAFVALDRTPGRKADGNGPALTIFELAAQSPDQTPAKSAQKPAARTPPPNHAVLPPPRIRLPDRKLPMLVVTKDVFEAADISKLGTAAKAPGTEVASGSAPGDTERVGTAPNGQPLYAAEWVREPTNAELAAYLPATMPDGGGSGLVACHMIDHFHVDNCQELGDHPRGSHLARSVRLAAWQFLVRPPRVGGKVLEGGWVRIRIDYGVR